MTEQSTPVVIDASDKPFVCPECSASFDKPFKLGSHRRQAHGVEGKSKQARSSRQRRGANPGAPTSVRVMRDMAEDAGRGKSQAAPSADQLTHALGRGLFTISTAIATATVEMDDGFLPTDELKEATLDYLSLSAPAARDVMEPVGRSFAGTGLNKRYGRAIVDNVDVVGSCAELVKLGFHWRRYFRMRAEFMAQMREGGAARMQQPPVHPAQQREAPPQMPTPDMERTPPPREGVLLTKDMVDQMRRAQ